MMARVALQWTGLLLLLAAPAVVVATRGAAATATCVDPLKKPTLDTLTKKQVAITRKVTCSASPISGKYAVGTTCTWTCKTGFAPAKPGKIVSACKKTKPGAPGSWETPNFCTAIKDAPCTVDTTKFDEYTIWKTVKCAHGKTCEAECAEGTSRSDGLPGVTCNNGVAKKLPGKCVPDPCELTKRSAGLPRFADFTTTSCGSGAILHGKSCNGQCPDGTENSADGPPKASCDMGKLTFSGGCTPAACSGTPAGAADFPCTSGGSSGDSCTGPCSDGAAGSLSAVCHFGSWSSVVGECYGSGLTNACTEADPCSSIQDAVAGSCMALASAKSGTQPAAAAGFSCRCNTGFQFDAAAKACVSVTAMIAGYTMTSVKTKTSYDAFAYMWENGMWNQLADIPKKVTRLHDVDLQSWPDSGYAYFSGINAAGSGTVLSLANDGDNSNWGLEFEDGNEACLGVTSGGNNGYAVCTGSGAIKIDLDGLWEATAGDDESYIHTDVKAKVSPSGNDAIVLRTTDATGLGLPEDSAILGVLSIWDATNTAWMPVASSDQSAFYAVSIYTETSTNDVGEETTIFHAWIAGDDMTFKWSSTDETVLEVVPTNTYGIRFSGISAIGPELAWVVGSRGTIMINTDGTTWELQESGVSVDLTAVAAVDGLTAIAVGADLTVTPIVWDGLTWSQQAASSDPPLANTVSVITGIDMVASAAASSGGGGGGDVSPSPPPDDYNYDYGSKPTTSTATAAATPGTANATHSRRRRHREKPAAKTAEVAAAAASPDSSPAASPASEPSPAPVPEEVSAPAPAASPLPAETAPQAPAAEGAPAPANGGNKRHRKLTL